MDEIAFENVVCQSGGHLYSVSICTWIHDYPHPLFNFEWSPDGSQLLQWKFLTGLGNFPLFPFGFVHHVIVFKLNRLKSCKQLRQYWIVVIYNCSTHTLTCNCGGCFSYGRWFLDKIMPHAAPTDATKHFGDFEVVNVLILFDGTAAGSTVNNLHLDTKVQLAQKGEYYLHGAYLIFCL